MMLKVKYASFIMFICALGSQLTDVSVGVLKLWELMAIIIFPFFMTKIHKKTLPFVLFFFSLLVISLATQLFTDVFFWNYGGLKQKYIISVVRFAELMLCISTAIVMLNVARKYKVELPELISKFITYNFYMTLFVLGLLTIDIVAGTHIVSYYQIHRLKGFYVEGGPYGLYLASLIFLEFLYKKRKMMMFTFAIALVFSQSKAGICAIAIFLFVSFMMKNKYLSGFLKPGNFIRFSFFVVLSISISAFAIFKIAYNYIDDYQNVYSLIKGRAGDPSLIMGRIAASHIGPKIFEDNPIFGVGLGGYSLVRNNLEYREGFPVVSGWDLTGLGGFFNLMIENGIFGVLGFTIIILLTYKKDLPGMCFMMLFIIPFIFGAQLYMFYPWVFLGFYFVYRYGDPKLSSVQKVTVDSALTASQAKL
ncbi:MULTISPECIES: O-antigen ligase family protein [Enterobacteriaceae]|uniref:O-antigen ligase family protein n=1 Tax=Klebsiella sp. 141161 TaxID=3020037 RepID=UPI000DE19E2B